MSFPELVAILTALALGFAVAVPLLTRKRERANRQTSGNLRQLGMQALRRGWADDR